MFFSNPAREAKSKSDLATKQPDSEQAQLDPSGKSSSAGEGRSKGTMRPTIKEFATSPSDRPAQPNPVDIEREAAALRRKNGGSFTDRFIKTDKDGLQSTNPVSGNEALIASKKGASGEIIGVDTTETGSLKDLSDASRKQIELANAIRARRVHGWDPPKALWRAPSEMDIKAVDHIVRRRNVEYYRTTQYIFGAVVLAAGGLFYMDWRNTKNEMNAYDELVVENAGLRTEIDDLKIELANMKRQSLKPTPIKKEQRTYISYLKFW